VAVMEFTTNVCVCVCVRMCITGSKMNKRCSLCVAKSRKKEDLRVLSYIFKQYFQTISVSNKVNLSH